LLISDGSLISLDVAVSSQFVVGRVTFTTKDLEFHYTAASNSFQLTGTASVAVGNVANLSVTFADQGLVITNGSLVSLDVAVSSSFKVGNATFGTDKLRFSYVVATDTFQLRGTAFVMIVGMGQVGVTFAGDGVVITGGDLVSLNATVNSNFRVGPATIKFQDLAFSYVAASHTLTLNGKASITA